MPRTVTGAAPALLALASTGTLAHAATFADLASEVRESLSYGKTSFMARYRWEHVNQVPFRDEANASTVRAALMYETKPWHGFSGALQYEAIGVVGEELYDRVPGFQGVNRYPVVQDPEGADLNQAWVRWASPAGPTQVAVKGGRQEIVLNNQRIIGPVGWRQNQQSFDAVTGQLVAWRDWSLSGGYFSKVHRITGDATRNTGGTAGAPVVSVNDGVLDMDSWYANAGWKLADRLSVAAYAVALNYESPQAKGNNSRTYGARLEGPWKLGDDWAVIGCAEAALQEDYADYAVGAVTDYQAW